MEEKNRNKRKAASWIRLIVSLLVALSLTSVLILGITQKDSGSFFSGFRFGGNYYPHSDKYSVGSGEVTVQDGFLKEINIDWIDGSIEIVGSVSASAISVEETSSRELEPKNQVHYYYHNNKLDIRYRESGVLISNRSLKKHLVVTVPQALYSPDSLILNTDSVSSDLSVKDMDLKSLKTDSVSGSVTFWGRAGRIDCDTVSGHIQLNSYITPSSVECDTVSADATLCIPAESEFRAEHDAVSGKFHADDFSCQKEDGDTYVSGNGNSHFEFDSVSGDVTISAIH